MKVFTHCLLLDHNPFERIDTSVRELMMLSKKYPLNIVNAIISSAYKEYQLADTDYKKHCNERDIAILEILFATDARISEVCGLTPSMVDLNNHTIIFLVLYI